MLGFTAVLAAVLLAYALKVQINALSDTRRQSEELRRQRELADQAEASRFTELRQYLEQELASVKQAQQDSEQRLRDELATSTNTLSACIGEVDERLERASPTPPERIPKRGQVRARHRRIGTCQAPADRYVPGTGGSVRARHRRIIRPWRFSSRRPTRSGSPPS
jgi:hypothetical protein